MQTFALADIPLILFIGLIELLLSADNAGVLAVIVRVLPPLKRKKALFAGLISAVFLRAMGVLVAGYLIGLFWAQILGGLYLIYLTVVHLVNGQKKKKDERKVSFFKVVLKVELMDILFAVDSILAAFALAAMYYPSDILSEKLWVIYLGGIIGVLMLRMGTTQVMKWIDHHPVFEKLVFLIVGWMGLKLVVDGSLYFFPSVPLEHFLHLFFWVGSIIILIVGFLSTKWDKRV